VCENNKTAYLGIMILQICLNIQFCARVTCSSIKDIEIDKGQLFFSQPVLILVLVFSGCQRKSQDFHISSCVVKGSSFIIFHVT